jgi:predicted CXXCH cytochrome family protein
VHGSQHEGLLVAEGNELCFVCHQEKHTQTELSVVHEPFVEGYCSDCHDPHNSENEAQLVAPTRALCRLCHDPGEEDLIAAHYDIPIRGTDCTGCHDPHASTDQGLLLGVAHEPFADGSCEMCHMLETDTPKLVRATGARLCGVCHQDYPRQGDSVVHKPVADGDCAGCHLPHASEFASLTIAGPEQTCLRCHDDLRQRAEASKDAHPTSFDDGGACGACHQPHSSREEHLLSAGPIRTCLGCHETARHGHPLGSDRLDPRTGEEITCVTCHDPHGTEFPMQLRGDQSRGLCLECHKADGH